MSDFGAYLLHLEIEKHKKTLQELEELRELVYSFRLTIAQIWDQGDLLSKYDEHFNNDTTSKPQKMD